MIIEDYRHYSYSHSYLRDRTPLTTSLFVHPYAELVGFSSKKRWDHRLSQKYCIDTSVVEPKYIWCANTAIMIFSYTFSYIGYLHPTTHAEHADSRLFTESTISQKNVLPIAESLLSKTSSKSKLYMGTPLPAILIFSCKYERQSSYVDFILNAIDIEPTIF